MYKKSYLAPQSQPWGRAIEQEINETSALISQNKINSDNELRQMGSTVSLLNRNKNQLVLQQTSLEAQQDYLETLDTYTTSSPSVITINGTGDGSYPTLKILTAGYFYVSRAATIIVKTNCDTSSNTDSNLLLSVSLTGLDSILPPSNIIFYDARRLDRTTFNVIRALPGYQTIAYTSAINGDNRNTSVFKITTPGLYRAQFNVQAEMPVVGKYITASNAVLSATII
jgi:hypothetical protein